MSNELSEWEKAKARAGMPSTDASISSTDTSDAPDFPPSWSEPNVRTVHLGNRVEKQSWNPEVPVRESETDIFLADRKFVTPEHARRPAEVSRSPIANFSAKSASVSDAHTAQSELSEPTRHGKITEGIPKILEGIPHTYESSSPHGKIVGGIHGDDMRDAATHEFDESAQRDAQALYHEQYLKSVNDGEAFHALTMRSPATLEHHPDIKPTLSKPFQGRVSGPQMIVRGVVSTVAIFLTVMIMGLIVIGDETSSSDFLAIASFLAIIAWCGYLISLLVRRLHDAGYSGFWAFPLTLIFFVSFVIALILPRQEFHNIYGNYEP